MLKMSSESSRHNRTTNEQPRNLNLTALMLGICWQQHRDKPRISQIRIIQVRICMKLGMRMVFSIGNSVSATACINKHYVYTQATIAMWYVCIINDHDSRHDKVVPCLNACSFNVPPSVYYIAVVSCRKLIIPLGFLDYACNMLFNCGVSTVLFYILTVIATHLGHVPECFASRCFSDVTSHTSFHD